MRTSPRAAIYDSTVAHVRHGEPPASFGHRIYLWLVDLDALPLLPLPLRPFARFDGRDHFAPDDSAPIRRKLDAWLACQGIDLAGGQVLMLASARVLGYVFNPITVYWCHYPDGTRACTVVEVHNTYGGRHAYLTEPDEQGRASLPKEFAVSPFQQHQGQYWMELPRPDALLSATVVLHDDASGDPALTATLRGVRKPATTRSVARMLAVRPLVPQRVAALIGGHGIALWLRRAARPPMRETMGNVNTPAKAASQRISGTAASGGSHG